jgi:hypothetical protein
VTHPNITITAAPATGTGSSSAWEDQSIDQILLDIRVLIDTAGEVSFGMRETTDVALPRAAERLLTTLRMGTGDGTLTLMTFIRQTYPQITWHRLDELAVSAYGDGLFACTWDDVSSMRAAREAGWSGSVDSVSALLSIVEALRAGRIG